MEKVQHILIIRENEIKIVAVALTDEAINLRNAGFNQEILILNELLESDLDDVIKYNLTPKISVYEIAKKLNDMAIKENKKNLKEGSDNMEQQKFVRKNMAVLDAQRRHENKQKRRTVFYIILFVLISLAFVAVSVFVFLKVIFRLQY